MAQIGSGTFCAKALGGWQVIKIRAIKLFLDKRILAPKLKAKYLNISIMGREYRPFGYAVWWTYEPDNRFIYFCDSCLKF